MSKNFRNHRVVNYNQKSYELSSKQILFEIIFSRYFLQDFYVLYFSKTKDLTVCVCVSAKSYSLTLYKFFNRQDLSAIETERNAVFYFNKLTALSVASCS